MKRRICGSSSTTSTSAARLCASSVVIVVGFGQGGGGGRARERQREPERHPAGGPVLRLDASAVGVHDRAADRQPQAEAPPLAGGHAEELLEHLLLLAGRQARAVVGHLEHGRVRSGGGGD